MKINILILLIITQIIFSSNNHIIQELQNSTDWKLTSELSGGEKVYRKSISGKDLDAFRITKLVTISPSLIFDIVEDIDQYSEILVSSRIDSKIINKTTEYIDGYNYIYIDSYFFSDREYKFRMSRNENGIVWYLLESNGINNKAIYLNNGAGLWSYVDSDGMYEISYSLYMDIGGKIPKFLDNKLNYHGILNVFKDVINYSQGNLQIQK